MGLRDSLGADLSSPGRIYAAAFPRFLIEPPSIVFQALALGVAWLWIGYLIRAERRHRAVAQQRPAVQALPGTRSDGLKFMQRQLSDARMG